MTTIHCDICGQPVMPGRHQVVINDKLMKPPGAAFTVELLVQFPNQPKNSPDLCRRCLAGCATTLGRELADKDIRAKEAEPTL